MTVSSDRGLPYEFVAEVCDDLIASGYKPDQISCRRILAKTKTGSLSTISKHRERWLQGRQGLSHVVTSPNGEGADPAFPEDAAASFWGESDGLAALAAQYRLANTLERALGKCSAFSAENQAILASIKESERLLLSASRQFDQMMAARDSKAVRQREKLLSSRPLLQIPPDPGVLPTVDPKAEPMEGAGK